MPLSLLGILGFGCAWGWLFGLLTLPAPPSPIRWCAALAVFSAAPLGLLLAYSAPALSHALFFAASAAAFLIQVAARSILRSRGGPQPNP